MASTSLLNFLKLLFILIWYIENYFQFKNNYITEHCKYFLLNMGPPRWYSGKNLPAQCRKYERRGFHPWVEKIPWSRKWQPAPTCLHTKSRGQRSLVGYSPWGGEELDMSEHTCPHTGKCTILKMQINSTDLL